MLQVTTKNHLGQVLQVPQGCPGLPIQAGWHPGLYNCTCTCMAPGPPIPHPPCKWKSTYVPLRAPLPPPMQVNLRESQKRQPRLGPGDHLGLGPFGPGPPSGPGPNLGPGPIWAPWAQAKNACFFAKVAPSQTRADCLHPGARCGQQVTRVGMLIGR